MTDTQLETRGCPEIKPVDAPPELDRFMTAMRRLDIAVSTDPDGARRPTPPSASKTSASDWSSPGSGGARPRRTGQPPPRIRASPDAATVHHRRGVDGVTMQGHFTRYHVGGNNAVHGGAILLFFDWQFGMVVSAAGRPVSRTAYLQWTTARSRPSTSH